MVCQVYWWRITAHIRLAYMPEVHQAHMTNAVYIYVNADVTEDTAIGIRKHGARGIVQPPAKRKALVSSSRCGLRIGKYNT